MQAIRKILVTVKDPESRRQPGIEKAVQIAKRLGAELELFHAISTPVLLDFQPLADKSLGDIKRESQAACLRRLEKFGALARKRDVPVTCTVRWDYPPHEAIVRRATQGGADLIIAECHKGRRLSRWLVQLTDWELLRSSPIPVLLLKNARPYRRPVVLAAVDPSHAHAKPLRLDAGLVGRGTEMSRALGGSFHVMHSNYPVFFGVAVPDPALDTTALMASYESQLKKGRDDFAAFADQVKIPRARRHLVDGNPTIEIPKVAQALGADIVVMGAVSRSALKRLFIGNTAERVLDALPCDMLVVKPNHFAPLVPAQERGIRVVAPVPSVSISA